MLENAGRDKNSGKIHHSLDRVYSYTKLSTIVLSLGNSQKRWVLWAKLFLLGQNLFIFCFFFYFLKFAEKKEGNYLQEFLAQKK